MNGKGRKGVKTRLNPVGVAYQVDSGMKWPHPRDEKGTTLVEVSETLDVLHEKCGVGGVMRVAPP